jgi:GAF domain-containing protein
MFASASDAAASPADLLERLREQARALLEGERDPIANAANLSSLIFHTLPGLNWAGFYWMKDGELVLGPFQGKPACVRIAVGKGVCGTAVAERRTIVVPDVEAFPGHIACDSASRSEIVVPVFGGLGSGLRRGDEPVLGVLDIDSPVEARFDEAHAKALEEVVADFVRATDLDPRPGPRPQPRRRGPHLTGERG